MKVLIAPDCFTGTLTADQAAFAMATGWKSQHEDDEVFMCPLSDGGPGFVDTLSLALEVETVIVEVCDPLGRKVPATIAISGRTAYVESAMACGLHLIENELRDPRKTSSFGLGELIAKCLELEVSRIVVGLGGSGTNDGGAGMLAALGAVAVGGTLDAGGYELRHLSSLDLTRAQDRFSSVELVIASDVDNPLLGIRGATATFAKQKGADENAVMQLEGALTHFSSLVPKQDGKNLAVALGAGAAGGIGYALLLLGASRVSGVVALAELLGLTDRFAQADLIITGEGCLDDQTLHGKVVMGVAGIAAANAKPCIAIAGQVRLGKRELATAGIDAAYDMSALVGKQASFDNAEQSLIETTARVAKTWGRR